MATSWMKMNESIKQNVSKQYFNIFNILSSRDKTNHGQHHEWKWMSQSNKTLANNISIYLTYCQVVIKPTTPNGFWLELHHQKLLFFLGESEAFVIRASLRWRDWLNSEMTTPVRIPSHLSHSTLADYYLYIYNITFKHEIMTTFGWSVPLNPLEFLAPNRCDLHPFGPPTMAAVDSAEPRTPRGKISEILKRKGAILKASFGKFRAMFKARLDEEWWGLLLST